MGQIIHLPARKPVLRQNVEILCAQLSNLHDLISDDVAGRDAITEAEFRVLSELVATRACSLDDVARKLAALERRAAEAGGFCSDGDLDLLRSALADLQRVSASIWRADIRPGG